MTAFFFNVPETHEQSKQQDEYHRILLEKARYIEEVARQEREEEARLAALPESRLVTFRIPRTLLLSVDQLAKSKGFSRGHFLRHIAADFVHQSNDNTKA